MTTQKCVSLPVLETKHEDRNLVGAAAHLRGKNLPMCYFLQEAAGPTEFGAGGSGSVLLNH